VKIAAGNRKLSKKRSSGRIDGGGACLAVNNTSTICNAIDSSAVPRHIGA
jgi:hypothetical protein